MTRFLLIAMLLMGGTTVPVSPKDLSPTVVNYEQKKGDDKDSKKKEPAGRPVVKDKKDKEPPPKPKKP